MSSLRNALLHLTAKHMHEIPQQIFA